MTRRRDGADAARHATAATRRRPLAHLHWFRRAGDDPFSGASLYRCRCGEVRPGF